MNNRLSFASVLRGNHSTQSNFVPRQKPKTLSEYMDIYMQCGENYHSYNISFDQSGTQSNRNINNEYTDYEDYEEGVNPLDAWMSSQAFLSRENINAPKRKNSPNNLMKLVNSKMDPRQSKNSYQKPVPKLEPRKPQKNMNMKELCKMYAQQKDSCESSYREPVWKFNSRQDSQNLESSEMKESIQNEREFESRKYMLEEKEQSQEKLSEVKEQSQEKLSEVKEDKISEILKKIPVAQKEKKSLGPIVQEIKENLVSEIGMMAEQIVTNRKKEDEEEMLISQRSNTAHERIQNARKQIGQYLKIKEQNIKKEEVVQDEPQQPPQQEVHDGVGYSFSHQFNEASKKVEEKNRQSMLPNIEEVRSEQDYAEVHHQDLNNDQEKQIENEYIQKIQSVAYFDDRQVEEDPIKQSYRYSEPKHFQPPTIELSLEKYVQQPQIQKSQEEINPVCSKTKEEFERYMEKVNENFTENIRLQESRNQPLYENQNEQVYENMNSRLHERMVESVGESMDQHSIVQETIKIEQRQPQMKESKQYFQQKQAETDSLQINSVLHRPQLNNSIKIQPQKQQSFSVASSLKQQVESPSNQPQPQILPQEKKVEDSPVKSPEVKAFMKESLRIPQERTQIQEINEPIKVEQKMQSKLEFRRIISPQQSIKEEKKVVPVPQASIETKKQESQEKPKRLLKITLSPKYQQKVVQPEPATNPFTIQEKPEEPKVPDVKMPPISTQKVPSEDDRKENNELLMNKFGKESKSSPVVQVVPEVKSSVKISSYAMKESVRRELDKKGSVKKSIRGQVSLKNSLVDDFQFDLDI